MADETQETLEARKAYKPMYDEMVMQYADLQRMLSATKIQLDMVKRELRRADEVSALQQEIISLLRELREHELARYEIVADGDGREENA